jgi:thymidylate kinase
MVLDWNLGYWRKIRSQRSQGFLVIADRHSLLDMLADPERYRYGGETGWVRMALRVVPAPDMVVLLDASPEVLQARKQELTPAKTAYLRRKYLEIFEDWPNCLIVDAARPLDEIVSEILLVIEKRYLNDA